MILAVLAWRLGAGPLLDGVPRVTVWSLLAATSITALTTVCSAWRWRTVARGPGADLPLRAAVAAYYRSQFLNSALPGGVLGDVHRGVWRQGPREGVAAWAFGAAGLGAAQEVAAATAYGVMALVATLPGAVVLATDRLRRRRARAGRQPINRVSSAAGQHG